MHYVIYLCLLNFLLIYFNEVSSVGISSKLDFGTDNSDQKTILFKNDGSSKYKIVKEEKKADFDGIGVVCVSGNCNKTNTDSNVVSTDVLVHVRTNVNISGANNTKEEIPDIPVVVGYGSSGVQSIPNNDGVLNQINPTYNTKYNINPPDYNEGTRFVPLQPEIITIPASNTNFRPINRPIYRPKTQPRNYKNVGFDQNNNNVQIQIPHRPYFVNHYFGEHPPQQLVWYPNGRSSHNPLEFKRNYRPIGDGVNWKNIRSYTTINPVGTTCTCQNDGSNYYTPTTPYHVHKRTPELQIDDKLAPLN